MRNILIVGLGGFAGAILRYLMSTWAQTASGNSGFPYGTLLVNLLGCLIIGFSIKLVGVYDLLNSELRLFAVVGLLGAFTTFSTFGGETFVLLREGKLLFSLVNIGVQLGAGLFAVWLGHAIASLLWT